MAFLFIAWLSYHETGCAISTLKRGRRCCPNWKYCCSFLISLQSSVSNEICSNIIKQYNLCVGDDFCLVPALSRDWNLWPQDFFQLYDFISGEPSRIYGCNTYEPIKCIWESCFQAHVRVKKMDYFLCPKDIIKSKNISFTTNKNSNKTMDKNQHFKRKFTWVHEWLYREIF